MRRYLLLLLFIGLAWGQESYNKPISEPSNNLKEKEIHSIAKKTYSSYFSYLNNSTTNALLINAINYKMLSLLSYNPVTTFLFIMPFSSTIVNRLYIKNYFNIHKKLKIKKFSKEQKIKLTKEFDNKVKELKNSNEIKIKELKKRCDREFLIKTIVISAIAYGITTATISDFLPMPT